MASEKREQAIERGKAKADKQGKDRAKKKGKGKGKGASGAPGASVAGHPRAAAAVKRAKGFGGIAGFALAAFISRSAGITLVQVLERALLAGIAGYLLAWACAVTVWRHVVLAELKTLVENRAAGSPGPRMVSLSRGDAAASVPEAAAAPAPPAAS